MGATSPTWASHISMHVTDSSDPHMCEARVTPGMIQQEQAIRMVDDKTREAGSAGKALGITTQVPADPGPSEWSLT